MATNVGGCLELNGKRDGYERLWKFFARIERTEWKRRTWNTSWNNCGTEYGKTRCKTVEYPVTKSLKGKDGWMFVSAHNPKVGGSNPPPATMNATAEMQWRSPVYRSVSSLSVASDFPEARFEG